MIQYVWAFCISLTFSVAIVVVAREVSLLKYSVDSLRSRVACSEEAFIRLRDKIDNKDHKATNREKFKEVFGIDIVLPDCIGVKKDLNGRSYAEVIRAQTWLDTVYREPKDTPYENIRWSTFRWEE